ncbi:hypothetical protein [Nostoc sp.]|uniref:hypothetical protein n=1 Tax=Nostoc sp. TaxID=1180 RepID=UPI002FF93AD0
MTLLRRYRYANAVPHGGNPLQPYGHPTAGASLSRMGEDRTASPFQINETFTLYFF